MKKISTKKFVMPSIKTAMLAITLVFSVAFNEMGMKLSAQGILFSGGSWNNFKQLVENPANGDLFYLAAAPDPALPGDSAVMLFRDVTIIGTGPNITLTMANASERHFMLFPPFDWDNFKTDIDVLPTLTLKNITLFGDSIGGGVHLSYYTNLDLENVVVEYCFAKEHHWNLYIKNPDGSYVNGFTSDTIVSIGGGGIWAWKNSTINIKGGRFSHNSAHEPVNAKICGPGGGAISSQGTVIAENTLFNYNSSVEPCLNSGGGGGGGAITAPILTLKNCEITHNSSYAAGGISAKNLTLIGNIIVTHNEARTAGGIWGSKFFLNELESLTVTHNKSTSHDVSTAWEKNYLVHGGGGGILVDDSLVFPSTVKVVITDNLSGENGGGIFTRGISTPLTLAGHVTISNNKAGYNFTTHECENFGCGGGVFSHGPLTIKDTLFVFNNKSDGPGGGICATHGEIVSQADTISIHHNIAGHFGGGIAAQYGLTLRNKTDITYNKAVAGGGIFSTDFPVTLGGKLNVSYNEASNFGGGIATQPGSVLIIEDYTQLAVSHNKAIINSGSTSCGGGIYSSANLTIPATAQVAITHNLTGSSGGGIYSISTATLKGSGVDISYNKAGYNFTTGECSYPNYSNGGGIFAVNLVMENTKTVTHNEASGNGGGICMNTGGNLTLDNAVNISHNIAKSGGGIYLINGSLTLSNDVTISHNTAHTGGGGIVKAENCTVITAALKKLTVNNNSAKNDGGGIHSASNFSVSKLTFPAGSELEVSNNLAGGNGGGIYDYGMALTLDGTATISNNKAGYDFTAEKCMNDNCYYGGGIYMISSSSSGPAMLWSGNINITGNMSGGTLSTNTYSYDGGGGIYLNHHYSGYSGTIASLSFPAGAKVNISNNIAGGAGGGIGTNISLTSRGDLTISNNKAGYDFNTGECSKINNSGGGICAGINFNGTISFNLLGHSTISNNIAGGAGGGIYAPGGECYQYPVYLTIDSSIISGNIAKYGDGGGIYKGIDSLAIFNSKIIGNKTDYLYINWNNEMYRSGNGGGIYCTRLYVNNCEIAGNTAGNNGGGIALQDNIYTQNIKMFNVKVQGNYAGNKGGGVCAYLKCESEPFELNNANMGGSRAFTPQEIAAGEGVSGDVGNFAPIGGGIFINDPFKLQTSGNITFSGNSAKLPNRLLPKDRQSVSCVNGGCSEGGQHENSIVTGSSVINHTANYTSLRTPENSFSEPPAGEDDFLYAFNNYDVNWGALLKVTYVPNNGEDVIEEYVMEGSTANPPIITNGGKEFLGWYRNKKMTGMPFDFSKPILTDEILYAKWKQDNVFPYEIWNWEDLSKLNEMLYNDYLGKAFKGDSSEMFSYYDYEAILMQDLGVPGENNYGDGTQLVSRRQGVIDKHPGDKRFGWYGYEGFIGTNQTIPYESYNAADPTGLTAYQLYGKNKDTCGWKMTGQKGWIPIGFEGNNYPFEGLFDGQGFAVNGLWIDRNEYRQGLFGTINEALIKELSVNTASKGINAYAESGILAANVEISGIYNCHVNGNITGRTHIGGMVGALEKAVIKGCSAEIDVSTVSEYTGGLVADVISAEISDSWVTGRVSGQRYIGGLIGDTYNENDYSTVTNCYMNGTVEGRIVIGGLIGSAIKAEVINCSTDVTVIATSIAGGLIGSMNAKFNESTILTDCYAKGSVTGEYTIGGLVGEGTGSIINNCSADVEVTATDYEAGGLIAYANAMQITNSLANGNVKGTEHVGGLVGYAETLVDHNCWGCSTVDTSAIIGCHAHGDVTGEIAVGGLVGYMQNANWISSYYELIDYNDNKKTNTYNSWATGNVSGIEDVGGFVGKMIYGNVLSQYIYGDPADVKSYDLKPLTISRCWASGEVSGENNVGGFSGTIKATFGEVIPSGAPAAPLDKNVALLLINQCYADGKVTGNNNAGGFSGTIDKLLLTDLNFGSSGSVIDDGLCRLLITECYATGEVKGENETGGFAASLEQEATLTECYATGDVSGNSTTGGFAGYANTVQILNCYANGNVTGNSKVGGLVGSALKGQITHSFALNANVSAKTSIGRVIAEKGTNMELNENYGLECMKLFLEDNQISAGNNYASGEDGTDISQQKVIKGGDDDVWSAWNFTDIWTFDYQYNNPSSKYQVTGKTNLPILAAFTEEVFPQAVQPPYATCNYKDFRIWNWADLAYLKVLCDENRLGEYDRYILMQNLGVPEQPDTYGNGVFKEGTPDEIVCLYESTRKEGWYGYLNWINTAGYTGNINNFNQSLMVGGTAYAAMAFITNCTPTGNHCWNAEGWNPIGTASYKMFWSLFEGQNFTISGLWIDRDESDQGLFGSLRYNATIQNLNLNIIDTVRGRMNVGALAGSLCSGATITNCHVTGIGRVEATDAYSFVGGLLGSVSDYCNTPTKNGATKEEVKTKDKSNRGGESYAITNCSASVEVIGLNYVGGLIGNLWNVNIKNNYATGKVTGDYSVGGLIGITSQTGIRNNFATGNVTGAYNVGGLIGMSENYNYFIDQNYATGDVKGYGNVGGLIGYLFAEELSSCYATGDVTQSEEYIAGDAADNAKRGVYGGAGGLVGYMDHADMDRCYATGTVSGEWSNAVGGLVGYFYACSSADKQQKSYSEPYIRNSYALNSEISTKLSSTYIGRVVGVTYCEELFNNYALVCMKVTCGPEPPPTKNKQERASYDKNGEDISLNDATNESTYTNSGWLFDNIWTFNYTNYYVIKVAGEATNLPILSAFSRNKFTNALQPPRATCAFTIHGTVFPFVHDTLPDGTPDDEYNKLFTVNVRLYQVPPFVDGSSPVKELLRNPPVQETTAYYYDGTIYVSGTPLNPGAIGNTNNPGKEINWAPMGITPDPVDNTAVAEGEIPTKPVGIYTFTDVKEGTYILRISANGFLTRYAKIVISNNNLGHRELIPGDVTGDMVVDQRDIVMVNAMFANYPDQNYRIMFDLNKDRKVDMKDTRFILDLYNAFSSLFYVETWEWMNGY